MGKLLKQKRAIITSLKKTNEKNKNKKINVHSFFENAKFPSTNSKALISMQLLHKKRKSWSTSEKKLLYRYTTNHHLPINLCEQMV